MNATDTALGTHPPDRAESARILSAAEIAWTVIVPCALPVLASALLLGPALGRALFPRGFDVLWPSTWWEAGGHPEPAKHARYLIATALPFLVIAVMLLGLRREWRLSPRVTRTVVAASQLAVVAVVAFGFLGQQGTISFGALASPPRPVFGLPTLAAAAALLTVTLIVLREGRLAAWIGRLSRETMARRWAGAALAVAIAALWMQEVVMSDRLVEDHGLFNWTLNDAFAVLDGRTPLVDYHLIYGKLMPYPAALVLAAFGASGLVYTLLLMVLNVLALVAVYAVLRRIVGGSLLALGAFAPFVALSDLRHIAIQAGLWPMRYGFAYPVAWLLGRHVDGRRPRHAWVLFLLGGLAAINSMEFGLGVLGGSVLAIVCVRPPRTRRAALRLTGALVGGTFGSIALVSILTLARAGRLPEPAGLTEWPRIFTNLGWFELPVPVASLHLAVFATFMAAIVLAAVRAIGADQDAVLTAMLMWAGVVGLAGGNYYAGRAEDGKLTALLSVWGFVLVLLTIACVRSLTARSWRSPRVAELLVLLGFAVAVCTTIHVPSPVAHLRKLAYTSHPLGYRPAAERFIRERTHRGEKVAVMLPEGDRIAYDLGLDDVSPYGFMNAIVTRRQMQTLIDAVRREGVRKIFLPAPEAFVAGEGDSAPEQLQLLETVGYRFHAVTGEGFVELRAESAARVGG